MLLLPSNSLMVVRKRLLFILRLTRMKQVSSSRDILLDPPRKKISRAGDEARCRARLPPSADVSKAELYDSRCRRLLVLVLQLVRENPDCSVFDLDVHENRATVIFLAILGREGHPHAEVIDPLPLYQSRLWT